jgi:hypothetical protein
MRFGAACPWRKSGCDYVTTSWEENMRQAALVSLTLCALVALTASAALAGGARIGAGIHYWKTLDKIEFDEIEENGVSWIATAQFGAPSLLKFQADLEIFPKKFAGFTEVAYAPQAFVIVGTTIYGGLGIGTYYVDGEFADNPFYMLRAGVDLELMPTLFLDINANYRFENWDKPKDIVDEIDTDVITLGAAVRVAF